jgi:hypothetical protein
LGGSMPDYDIAPRDSRVSYHSDSTSSNTKVAEEK